VNKVMIEHSGPIQTIWLNRPEKRNALDHDMRRGLTDALCAPLAPDDRVMVIRGKGNVFCSGLDMAERRETAGTGEASGIEVMRDLQR
jgi:enoyl-CoA hydratase/carnithine racemase